MRHSKKLIIVLLILAVVVVACSDDGGDTVDVVATATLIPPPGSIPDPSATPFMTRTPLPSPTPTFTNTPVPSETPLPSTTPTPVPIIGIIRSIERVNIRTGPGVDFSAIYALTPGTGVEVLQTNPEGDWYNIEWEDEEDGLVQGWVFSNLLFIQDPPTPVPTFTLTPDLTALALGTGTPIGGGTITATPPRSAVTATPIGTEGAPIALAPSATAESSGPSIPTLDLPSIDLTATALAGGGGAPPTPRPASTSTDAAPPTVPPAATQGSSGSGGGDDADTSTSTPRPTPSGNATVQTGVDIFAMCNNPNFNINPPTNLAAGSTGEVYWAWYMAGPEFEQQHLSAVNYEVRINGRLLDNWRQYGQRTIEVGESWAKYWYVPTGELEAGEYTITYRATWNQQITDGWDVFGPGTRNAVEEGSCDFTVQG